jgi:Fe-S oxidoreductase
MSSAVKTEKDKFTVAKEMLGNLVDRRVLTALEVCVRCGICTESCHYYQSNPKTEHTPYYRAEMVRRLYRRFFDPIGRAFPQWVGVKESTDEMLAKLAEIAFASCTLCHRCTFACPFGVETAEIMRVMRAIATATGNAPEMLVELANMALAKEESADLFRDIYLEQVKDLEKEVQDRLGSSKARIPVGQKGARMLYVPLAGAHTIVPEAILFNSVGASWTLGMFEASNYAVFLADGDKAKRIANRIIKEAEQTGAEEIIITECGHAYFAMRWEVPKWLGHPLPFKVRSILEVIDEYLREGRLHLDSSKNTQLTTYHDSCNLGRKGGIFDEPRRIVKASVSDFREMTPNRLDSYCCGAGSGLVAVPEFADIRMEAGKHKAEQIKRTEAGLVITSCDNCLHQIRELNEHYGLNIEASNVSQLVVKALV